MSVYRPQERRLVLRLLAYWDDVRDERPFLRVSDVESEVIGDDWAHCHILKIAEPPERSQFLHIGEELMADLPPDWSGTLGDCPRNTLLYHASYYLDRVLAKRVPVSLGGQGERSGQAVLYRSILLPLSNDGKRIDHVLGGANSRVITEGEGDATNDG